MYDLDNYWRIVGGNYTTIPQFFKENGYISIGAGKIYHSGQSNGNNDNDYSWSEPAHREPGDEKWESKAHSWQIAEPEENAATPQRDELLRDFAVEKLQELAAGGVSGEQPFFLGVGFHRPHLPLVAPREFFDLYNDTEVNIAPNPHVPHNLPNIAYSTWGELRDYDDVKALNIPTEYNTTLPDDFAINLRRAYYASTSFVDSLFGDILAELDRLQLSNNTIVIVFSDNGYQLGEHSEWCKHTNLDIAARVPIMMRVPGVTDGGTTSSAFVELVDIFPTLVEASGLGQLPVCPPSSYDVMLCHEGHSFLALAEGATEWKDAAYFQYMRNSGREMGYAIRTAEYQYVRWVGFRLEQNIAIKFV